MAQTSSTEDRYWKVVGSELQDDGTILHHLKQVADYLGNPTTVAALRADYVTPAANEQPRGTIVRVTITTTVTRTVTINPTS